MTAAGAQTTYEWVSAGDQNELVAQLEELSYQLIDDTLGSGNGLGGPISSVLKAIFDPIQDLLDNVNGGPLAGIATTVSAAINIAISFLNSLNIVSLRLRMEVLRNSGDSDAIKMYAMTDLGAVVAFSNGLEACLQIAIVPAAAAKEMGDEDYDEDDEGDEAHEA
ncbi:hypothetical protein BG015_006704 [Linnemannia schmuckeri]|uniref:Uncharacterized protein n=1 Tax=Linnemannia schmuckeri TaxID=64567 RepID=A0A9P5RZE1_9FUNG|nr:hypothetical protein BG015_006704 [Linnemannia schmuckeri]